MTSIAQTNSPSISDLLSQFISGATNTASAAATPQTSATSPTQNTSALGPATVLTLSDGAKTTLAKAKSDQAAADRLQAYVEAHSVSFKQGTDSTSSKSDPFPNLLDTTLSAPTTTELTGASKSEATIASNQAIADANTPQPVEPFVPTKAVAGSLSFAGYTVRFSSDPSRLYSGLDVSGNGVSAYSRHFWPSDGGGGADALPPGVGISIGASPTNPAEDFVTITQNTATATSAAAASSSGAAVATSAVTAQSSSITFVVNYATGKISVQQSAASVSAKAGTAQPGSLLSALA